VEDDRGPVGVAVDGGDGGGDEVPMEYSQTQSTVLGSALSCHTFISRAPVEYCQSWTVSATVPKLVLADVH